MAHAPTHDRALFVALHARLAAEAPGLRAGSMFGCPAAFLDGRMAFCVFRTQVGVKVPAELAAGLVAQGLAQPFRPFGRPPMREWISVVARADDQEPVLPILRAALAHAAAAGPKSPRRATKA